ncbi:MAG: hypothetical protein ABL949_05925 [Fimbriimonadaceae bacterium]
MLKIGPQHANDLNGIMGAKTLLYKLMVLSPIFFIVWIAGTGRFRNDGFQFVACTVKQQQAIRAYRPYVSHAAPVEQGYASPEQIRSVCNTWINGYRKGDLQPLTPVQVGDSVNEGIKRQIRVTRDSLILELRKVAKQERRLKNYDQAFQDYALAIVVDQILKGSDATAERVSAVSQTENLREIEKLIPNVSRANLASFLVTVQSIKDGNGTFDRVVRQFGVMVMQDSKSAQTYGHWNPLFQNAKNGIITPAALLKTIRNKPKHLVGIPPPLAELYLAHNACNDFDAALIRVTNKISVLLNPKNVPTVRLAQFNL